MLKDYFTFDDYRWAVSTVMTRQNQVPVKDLSKTTNTLVPFWDFSNHHCSTGEEEISTDFSDETGETFCMANRDFSAGGISLPLRPASSRCKLVMHSSIKALSDRRNF